MTIYKTKKELKEKNQDVFRNRRFEKEIIRAGIDGDGWALKYRCKPPRIISSGEGYLYQWEYA